MGLQSATCSATSASTKDSIETKWHVAGVDPDGSLKLLVESLAPEAGDRPYDYAQRIAAPAVNFLFDELIERGHSLEEALGLEGVTESRPAPGAAE